MSDDLRLVLKYFPEISSGQVEKFSRLKPLYEEWNSKINVISRKDMENFYLHHVLHSLSIAKVIQFTPGTKILDVGTGGGFPGIPLAILFPKVQFHLVDSIGKKISVVNEVVKVLHVENVGAMKSRAEDLDEKVDFVVCRAVTSLKSLVEWTQKLVRPEMKNVLANGTICLKGGDLEQEINEAGKAAKVYDLSGFFEEDFFLTKKVVYVPF